MSHELQFPVKSPQLRRHLMRHDLRCPECGGDIDVGYARHHEGDRP